MNSLHPLTLSLGVATLATGLSLVLGVALAALLWKRRFFGRELLDALLALPLVLPPTVLGYYLLVVLGRHSALGRAFEAVFGAPLTFTPLAAVIAAMTHALPSIAKSARAALAADPDPWLRAAALVPPRGPRAGGGAASCAFEIAMSRRFRSAADAATEPPSSPTRSGAGLPLVGPQRRSRHGKTQTAGFRL